MKATIISFLSLLVSLTFFTLLLKSQQVNVTSSRCSTAVASPQATVETKPADPNEKFRTVPSNFAPVDFNNRSYGLYTTASRATINVNLIGGRFDYSDSDGGHWFDLKDVYYTDVTGDESLEAIVVLSHVECNVSCDGGRSLFVAYETYGGGLNELWRFETGSYAYGCGLKSLTIMKQQITVQMFGKCLNPESGYGGPGKFLIGDTTLSHFRLAGPRFVRRETEFFSTPVTDVKNYQAQIHIID